MDDRSIDQRDDQMTNPIAELQSALNRAFVTCTSSGISRFAIRIEFRELDQAQEVFRILTQLQTQPAKETTETRTE
jgi:hypothetical protein